MTKAYPRDLYLEGGQVVPVSEVYYPLGRNYYRVGWVSKQGERGCIAEWTHKGFEELSKEDFLRDVRGVQKRDS